MSMRVIVCLATALFWFAAGRSGKAEAASEPKAPASEPKSSAQKPSLDEELLKDLGPDDALDDAAPASLPRAQEKPDGDALDRELLKGLGDGEDVGADSEDPLTRLNQQMRQAESLLARRQTDAETQRLQSQIIRDLEKLIRETKKQSKGGNSSSAGGGTSGKGSPQAAKRSDAAQPGKRSAPAQQPGNSPAQQSSKKTREDKAQQPDLAGMHDLIKGVWGRLPERQREQMLQSYEEQFLPKYEQMIADYFRSIATEEQHKP